MKLKPTERIRLKEQAQVYIKQIALEEGAEPYHITTYRRSPEITRTRKRVAKLMRMSIVERNGEWTFRDNEHNENNGWTSLSLNNIGEQIGVTHSRVVGYLK